MQTTDERMTAMETLIFLNEASRIWVILIPI